MAVNNKIPNYVTVSRTRNYFVASFVLIVIGVFVAFFYFYKSFEYSQKSQSYIQAEATVVDHNYSNNKVVSTVIEYEVDGKAYKSDYNFKSLNIQPYGSTITILYNPTHPEKITTIDSKVSVLLLYFGGFLTLAGIASAVFTVNKQGKDRNRLLTQKYQVSDVDASLPNSFQVNKPVDYTYKQIANVINKQTTAKEPSIVNNVVSSEVINDKPNSQAVVQDINLDNTKKPEVALKNATPSGEVINKSAENIIDSVLNKEDSGTQTYTQDPVDLLINEYAGPNVHSKKHNIDYKKEKRFEFASYAKSDSLDDNSDKISSFIPNIEEVEDLIITNNKKQ